MACKVEMLGGGVKVDLLYGGGFSSLSGSLFQYGGCTTNLLQNKLSAGGYQLVLFVLYANSNVSSSDTGSFVTDASYVIGFPSSGTISGKIYNKDFYIYGQLFSDSTKKNRLVGNSFNANSRMNIYGIKI